MNGVEILIASFGGVHLPPILALFGVQILPPPVALFLTVAFVIFLFRRDIRERPNVTGALWLPLLWMVISCSRPITAWLATFGLRVTGAVSLEEGSQLDALFYFALIAAGIYVLNKRGFNLGEFVKHNGWLMAFLLYCFIAIAWSDFPLVAFKRWIKILGLPIMALVLFTEPDFDEALTRIMKRSAYLLVPFSILLIKYYPAIGHRPSEWGLDTNTGVALGKNQLGSVCMVLGFFFFWLLLQTRRTERSRERRNELRLIVGFLLMISWLFWRAHCATALVCLLIAISVMLLLGRRWVNKKLIGRYALLTIVVLVSAQLAFGLSAYVIELLGRNATFSDRLTLWGDILKQKTNPIFGTGFESFWLGERLENLAEGRGWAPNEAHNGYLEIYVDLGLVGLLMLIGVIIATFQKIRLELSRNFEWGRLRLGFLTAVLLYNCTEVTFRGPHVLWLVFYIIAIEYPKVRFAPMEPSFEIAGREEEIEFASRPVW